MDELELSRLNTLMDALVEELTVPVALLVIEDPQPDELCTQPVWSPATEALVAEFVARTGGVR
jgi:hypothetical protein